MDNLQIKIDVPMINANTNFWMIRTKRGFFFDEFINQKFIGIGWNSITESMISSNMSKQHIDELKEIIVQDYGESKPGTAVNKCIKFCNEVKIGDIAVIVGNNKIALAYIGEYFENLNSDYSAQNEKEIHSYIEKSSINVNHVKCPYIKRRKIKVIKILGENDIISPYLHSAIARNWHSLSDLNEYSEIILSACYDIYAFKDRVTLTFRVKQKKDINVLDLASFVLGTANIISNNHPESVRVKTTLNSPGEIVLQISHMIFDNPINLIVLYIIIFGGKYKDIECNSLVGIIKDFKNGEYNDEKKTIELRKLKAEAELMEENVEQKKLENIEKRINIKALEEYSEKIKAASKNLEISPNMDAIKINPEVISTSSDNYNRDIS